MTSIYKHSEYLELDIDYRQAFKYHVAIQRVGMETDHEILHILTDSVTYAHSTFNQFAPMATCYYGMGAIVDFNHVIK